MTPGEDFEESDIITIPPLLIALMSGGSNEHVHDPCVSVTTGRDVCDGLHNASLRQGGSYARYLPTGSAMASTAVNAISILPRLHRSAEHPHFCRAPESTLGTTGAPRPPGYKRVHTITNGDQKGYFASAYVFNVIVMLAYRQVQYSLRFSVIL